MLIRQIQIYLEALKVIIIRYKGKKFAVGYRTDAGKRVEEEGISPGCIRYPIVDNRNQLHQRSLSPSNYPS